MPNLRYEYINVDTPILRGPWRSTLHSANAFAVESFIDEAATAAGRDPLVFRLDWLGAPRKLPYNGHGRPVFEPGRLAHVLRLAGDRAGWGGAPPAGRARGIAGHFTFGSYVAEVMEVSLDSATEFRVDRVVAVVDCGAVVNRSGVEAQVEGGILEGLCAALYGEITVECGRVRQTNFDSYRWLRIGEAPRVETYFVESGEAPRGLGEPPVPPVAPVLANALFALTGRRARQLPLRPAQA